MKNFVAGMVAGLMLAGTNATATLDTCQSIFSRLDEFDSKLIVLDQIRSGIDAHHRSTRSQLEKIERMSLAVCLQQRTDLYVNLREKWKAGLEKKNPEPNLVQILSVCEQK